MLKSKSNVTVVFTNLSNLINSCEKEISEKHKNLNNEDLD